MLAISVNDGSEIFDLFVKVSKRWYGQFLGVLLDSFRDGASYITLGLCSNFNLIADSYVNSSWSVILIVGAEISLLKAFCFRFFSCGIIFCENLHFLRCVLRLPDSANSRSHLWHLKGFSPVWRLMWILSVLLRINFCKQTLQSYGRTPVCLFRWSFRWPCVVKLL